MRGEEFSERAQLSNTFLQGCVTGLPDPFSIRYIISTFYMRLP